MLFLEFTEHWKMEHRKKESFCKIKKNFDMKLKVIVYELLSFFLRLIFARFLVKIVSKDIKIYNPKKKNGKKFIFLNERGLYY